MQKVWTEKKTQIVDEHGCSQDSDLLPNLSYSDDLTLAYSKARVFKYPDHSYLQFRCQVKLYSRNEEYKSKTPPKCSENGRKKRYIGKRNAKFEEMNEIDVATNTMLIFEASDL